jgi:hypothetical protein
MTEEVKPQEGTQQEAPPQVSEIEQRALEMGWRPKEEFDGPEDEFIDAKEFVRRKPLFDKIETQSKEIKAVRKAIDALKEHYSQREEAAVKAALGKLKEARKEAIANSDGESYEMINTEIERVEAESKRIKQLQVTQEEPEIHPEFQAWTNRNPWYADVKYMRAWADDFGQTLHRNNPDLNPSQVLKKVEEAVRKEFPHKFTNPNKANAPDVENGKQSSRGSGKGDSIEAQLDDKSRKIMNDLVRSGTLTKEEYLKQWKEINEIRKG